MNFWRKFWKESEVSQARCQGNRIKILLDSY